MLDAANTYAALGRHNHALSFRKEVLKVFRRVLPFDHSDIGKAIMNTAISYAAAGKHLKAVKLKEEAMIVYRKTLPSDHPDVATMMLNISNSYSSLGRHDQALDLREQAVAIYQRVLPDDHPDLCNAVTAKAASLCVLQRCEDAFNLARQVVASHASREPHATPADNLSLQVTASRRDIFLEVVARYRWLSQTNSPEARHSLLRNFDMPMRRIVNLRRFAAQRAEPDISMDRPMFASCFVVSAPKDVFAPAHSDFGFKWKMLLDQPTLFEYQGVPSTHPVDDPQVIAALMFEMLSASACRLSRQWLRLCYSRCAQLMAPARELTDRFSSNKRGGTSLRLKLSGADGTQGMRSALESGDEMWAAALRLLDLEFVPPASLARARGRFGKMERHGKLCGV